MIYYLSKIVLGLAIAFFPLLSHADTMVGPAPNEITLSITITLIPVVLSAVLLFMLRKKGVPLQPKPQTPIEKTRKEKRVLKLIKCFIIWDVLSTVFFYRFKLLEEGSILSLPVSQERLAINVMIGVSVIGVLIGIFSVIAIIFSVLFKKKESVRAKYWFLLFMVSYLPAQCFLGFMILCYLYDYRVGVGVPLFVILTQILFLLAIVVGLVVGCYNRIKKRND